MRTEEQIEITGNPSQGSIGINYVPKTDRTLFDICDINGRILKTGQITGHLTKVETAGLPNESNYIILIVDGDRVCSRKFRM